MIKLDKNEIPAKDMQKRLSDFFGDDLFVLRGVRKINRYKNGERTEEVAGYAYDVIDGASYSAFRVKVESSSPAIEPDQFEKSSDTVFVRIPLDKTIVVPYSVEFGRAKVTVVAPFVEVVKEG